MSKILLKINNDCELKYPANGYILGVDKYSFLFGKTFSVSKIKEIKESIKDKAKIKDWRKRHGKSTGDSWHGRMVCH